ncbi:TetR/AcrR family transcriptional regulator [Nonomuraea jiangxiensis]|uniref:DNA-binding transcriptional regulator, AcrR family n=1 Tax=Nonomuraea jiangxiensis TaxID=633440 RepID=A0A1G9PJ88_9ACTN|nr:TetR/AcrR family transcriptional regulator [Nonomuraea jiangxiensis]SDL98551.1 DNA-binding transcriptional regulator, AcrR family [Nonomuraea jiangxiensis]
MTMARPKTGARERLLADTVAYVAAHGMGELSLRDLAAAIGSSPRMLIFHFGSKEALLVEIVRAIERRQREFFRQVATAGTGTPVERLRTMWQHLTDPAFAPYQRLFFELYGQAVQGRPHATAMLDGLLSDWIDPVADIFEQMGMSPGRAAQEGRLAIAVARGLLMDLLATGDREAMSQAFEGFVSAYNPGGAPRQALNRPSDEG